MRQPVNGVLALAIFFAISNPMILAQQTTATVSGSARDPSGAFVPGATVTVRNTDTGLVRTMITDDQGRYSATQLPLGNYQVEIELAGFQREIRSGIRLTVGREAIVDFTLKIGEVTESVTVSSEAALIETTTSSLSGLVDDKQLRDLPLNGRSLDTLAGLEPGVTLSRGHTGINTRFNIGGTRTYQTKYLLDGSDIVSTEGYTPGSVAGVLLGVEAIREFRVLVNNFSTEFAGSAGGVVSAVTRSGTNELHGSVFEFHRNSAFDARNFFDPGSKPPPFKRNQFGFSLGGPIRKDQTFFFVNYEGLRDRLTTTVISNVPTLQARQGILPRSQIVVNPAVEPYLKLVPLPNGRDFGDGTGEFVGSQKTPADDDYFLVRIDQNFSPKDSLYVRYTLDDASKPQPANPGLFEKVDESRNQYFALEETRIFSQSVLNTLRAGVNRSVYRTFCNQLVQVPSSLDLVPGRSFGTGGGFDMTAFGFTGLTLCATTAPRLDYYNLYELADNITWNAGRHSIKSGLLVKNIRLNLTNWASYSGEYTFTSLENFLLGRPSLFRALFPDADATRSWRQTLYGFYVQDDFKPKVNLTLNLGLRYEFITGPTEVHGRVARLVNPMDSATTVLGRKPFVETGKTDFAPRAGFAWDPSGNGKLSLRGGFGLFFEPIMPYAYAAIPGMRQPPFYRRANLTSPPFPNAYEIIQRGVVETAINNFSPSATIYSMQFNLNVQRELAQGLVLSLAYIGSRGVHLYRNSDHNAAVPQIQADGRKFFPANSARRNPFFGEHLNLTTDAQSWYHGMVMSVRKQLSAGNQFQLSYTMAKMIDDSSQKTQPEGSLNSTRNTMDPEDLKRDRSLSALHVGQNFVFNYTYEPPLGRGRRLGGNVSAFVDKLIAGWQVSGITTIASGIPQNVELGFNAARNATVRAIGFHQRPDLVAGRSNNPVLGGPDKYMDWSAFRVPVEGYYGNLGRNTVSGPQLVNFDLALVKNTSIREGKELQFRVEMFNLANHANFGSPARIVFNNFSGVPVGSFGRITTTVTTARQIQLGLKFSF